MAIAMAGLLPTYSGKYAIKCGKAARLSWDKASNLSHDNGYASLTKKR
jgi:hypothetical protein